MLHDSVTRLVMVYMSYISMLLEWTVLVTFLQCRKPFLPDVVQGCEKILSCVDEDPTSMKGRALDRSHEIRTLQRAVCTSCLFTVGRMSCHKWMKPHISEGPRTGSPS